jgi:ribosome biogenesis GTPase
VPSATVPTASAPQRSSLTGVVLRARSGFYTVLTEGGAIECQLRGRVTRDRLASDPAVIGDRVAITPLPDGTGMIESVQDRNSRFSRRQPGPRGTWREDVMVANLDQVLVVFACADPMPHLRMVDRFLVVAEHNQVDAHLVVNKIDLCGEGTAHAEFATYERIGYPVHYVTALSGDGVDGVRRRLAGLISVVTGPSGVGKSTLLNAVQPGLHILTGEVSQSLGKGRHTTSAAELHPLAGERGGWVADTPGLRELGLWAIPPHELAWCFPEMRPHLGRCGFNDCRHVGEPRCAVRAAVADGDVSEARYDSYRRLVAGEG